MYLMISLLMQNGIVTGAERYAVAHKYVNSKAGLAYAGALIVIGLLLAMFVLYCAMQYIKLKKKDRY